MPLILRRALAFALVLACAASAAAAQDAGAPKEWRLSTAVGPAFALGKAGERWAQLVVERSRGTLPVVLRPGAVLAERDPGREFNALRNGAADLAVGSTLLWSVQVPALGAIGLPWLAPDDRALDALAGERMQDSMRTALSDAGVVPLAFAPLGHRELATVAPPVRTPDDLEGRSVRIVATPYLVDLFAGLRARPQSGSFADALSAFEAGRLTAQEGSPPTFAAARLDAAGVRYVTLWGAVAELAVFAANRDAWARLSEADRAIVGAAARDAAAELATLARRDTDAALAELRRRGVTILRLTTSGRAAFAAAARPVYDKWAAAAGDDAVRAAEAAVREATR